MKKAIQGILMLSIFVMLCGCSIDYDVKLSSKSIEYETSKLDVCSLITQINDTKIRDFNRKDGRIEEGDISVNCRPYTIRELGKQEVDVEINSISIPISFEVIDTTPPNIKVEKSEFKVEKDNEYFDLKKLVSISDLYDQDPVVGYTGSYQLDKPGKYTVRITAKDQSGNVAEKKITIVVTEKEVQVVESKSNTGGGSVSNGSSENTQPNQPQQSLPPTPTPVTKPSKQFLFDDGYDLQTGFEACKIYRGSASGTCTPLSGADGFPYGYQYIPY